MTNPTNPLLAALERWTPETDDRVEPLLFAEAGRRNAKSWDIDDAENVIAFLLSKLDTLSSAPAVDDLATVPRKPTEAMYQAGFEAEVAANPHKTQPHHVVPEVWQAMIAAAPAHPTATVAGEGEYCEKCDDSGYQVVNGKQGFCDCACGHDAMDQAEGKGLHAPSLSQPAGDAQVQSDQEAIRQKGQP